MGAAEQQNEDVCNSGELGSIHGPLPLPASGAGGGGAFGIQALQLCERGMELAPVIQFQI